MYLKLYRTIIARFVTLKVRNIHATCLSIYLQVARVENSGRTRPLPGGILALLFNHSAVFLCISKQTAGLLYMSKKGKTRLCCKHDCGGCTFWLCASHALHAGLKHERTHRLQCMSWPQSHFVTSNLCVWLIELLHLPTQPTARV